MLRRRFILALTGLLLSPPALAGQSPFRPILALGPELLETTSPIPTAPPARTTGFSPGIAFEVGLGYLPPGHSWGAELRGLYLSRSQHAADGCVDAAPDDCTLETQTRVTGVSLTGRWSPRLSHRLQPYLRSGVGIYQVYHSEPTAFVASRGGTSVQRDTRTVTTAAVVAGAGVTLGAGHIRPFVETSLFQYLAAAPRNRSLLLALGLRF
jgi:hypothetical protein